MTGEKPLARILIQRVWRQALGEITAEEARAEGFDNGEDFWISSGHSTVASFFGTSAECLCTL